MRTQATILNQDWLLILCPLNSLNWYDKVWHTWVPFTNTPGPPSHLSSYTFKPAKKQMQYPLYYKVGLPDLLEMSCIVAAGHHDVCRHTYQYHGRDTSSLWEESGATCRT